MARRTVYGNDWSENGWPMVDQGSCQWITVPGTDVNLEIQVGQPLAIMPAFAADFNVEVERIRDQDSACWTEGNSVDTSNHLSGTAMDLDWNSHPFQVAEAGFSPDQVAKIHELIDWYEGTIWWGDDWDSPKDAMHFQMGYGTYGNQHTQDFINRKIRPDGYSTRRGGVPQGNGADILARATGLTPQRAQEIQPAVSSGLQAAECTNAKRIAMWLAQCGEESAGFSTTEEFASGAEYEWRCDDLGNCAEGDGVKYKGRTWIQITGKAHYAEFSKWAFDKGLIQSPTQFVDNPTSLGDLQWAGVGAAWYWTVARPDINELSDAGDVVTVTHRINGGEHGLADRQSRYSRAIGLGDQLLTLISGEDELSAQAEKYIAEIHGALFNEVESRCIYAPEGDRTWQLHELIQNIDGTTIDGRVEELAHSGDEWALGLVADASVGKARDKSKRVINRALFVLKEIEELNPEILKSYLAGKAQA